MDNDGWYYNMATLINADTSDGLKLTSDTSGIIEFQSAGVTKAGVNGTGLTGDGSQLTGITSTGIDDNATSVAIDIDASENVGIGTTATSGLKLNVETAASDNLVARFKNTHATGSYGIDVVAGDDSGNYSANFSNKAGTSLMRIRGDGSMLVGTTSILGNNKVFIKQAAAEDVLGLQSIGSDYATMINFYAANGTVKGNISATPTTVAYNTSSDYRLKENVAPMSGSINRLKQLVPKTWAWVQDGSHGEGFLAHEAQAVVPEAVTKTKDAMMTEEYEVTPAVIDDGKVVTEAVMGTREVPDYQGIDQSKLVPLLTAALQEAITKIEDLETRIQVLENA